MSSASSKIKDVFLAVPPAWQKMPSRRKRAGENGTSYLLLHEYGVPLSSSRCRASPKGGRLGDRSSERAVLCARGIGLTSDDLAGGVDAGGIGKGRAGYVQRGVAASIEEETMASAGRVVVNP